MKPVKGPAGRPSSSMYRRQDGMPHKSIWEDLAEALKKIEPSDEPLRAEWFAFEGSQNYGIWLLRPDSSDQEDVRASFSLIAARGDRRIGDTTSSTPRAVAVFS